MSESSAPGAVADEPVVPEPVIPEQVDHDRGAGPVDEQPTEESTEELVAVPTPRGGGRHRGIRRWFGVAPGPAAAPGPTAAAVPVVAEPGARVIVLGPRIVAFLRLVRTSAPLALVAATLVACTTSSAPPAPPTARVERANITTNVSSAGSLAAITQQNIGFTKAGQLTSVKVAVGQRVTAGTVLATIDDKPARRILAQQQGQLDSQRAALTRLINATTVQGAQNTTNQAQNILDATQDQRSATIDADKAAVSQAKKQLDAAEDTRDDAKNALDAAKDACAASGGSSSASSSSSGSGNSPAIDAILNDPDLTPQERQKKLEAALRAAGAAVGSAVSTALGTSPCQQVGSAQAALDSADQQVQAQKAAVSAAQNRVDVDEAAQQVAVENARQGVVTAQNNLTSAQTDRPSLIAQQRGLVTAQEALVRQAQQDVDDTVLRAPVDATVSSINGTVGEFLTAGTGTTALAPGTSGPIPGVGSATGAAATAGTVQAPGAGQFIVLDNIDRFVVVAPFEEGDAVRIAPNQKVNVSFDAIPDLTLPGTVVSVSPSATALSGVISYYATVALAQGDPRLKNGLTAQVAVATNEVDDVLSVPNSAVHHEGNRSTVTVLGFDGPRTVEFQPGVVGDERTQVLSGLTAGDEVVVPSTR